MSFDETGILVKTDALGSLEALLLEAKDRGIQIEQGTVGPVSRRDVMDRESKPSILERAILAFNVPVLPDAAETLTTTDVKLISGDVIYTLLDNFAKWKQQRTDDDLEKKRKDVVFPGKMLLMPNHVFRLSKPAIVGVRVLSGRIMQGTRLIRSDGREAGKLKSIRAGEKAKTMAIAGDEVAMAIDGPTVGRQISEGDVLYSDIPESDITKLMPQDINFDESQVLEEFLRIKRKTDPFWGK